VLEEKNSSLEIRYQGTANDAVYFLVTNSGNRAGSVSDLTLNVSRPVEGSDIVSERVAWRFQFAPVIVSPGDSKQVVAMLTGDARKILDRAVYANWLNNEAVKPKPLPEYYFSVRFRNFHNEGGGSDVRLAPSLNSLLIAGPTDWHKCAGSLSWAAWNEDPSSHIFPQDITPDVVAEFCGPLPEGLTKQTYSPLSPPEPDANLEASPVDSPR
jgi:hypothetical protein